MKTFLLLINEVTAQESSESNDTHKAFLSSYKDFFMHDLPPGLPASRPEDHRIDTIPSSASCCRAPYRVNPHEQQEIKSQVKDLLDRGLIKPSSLPYGAPVLLVKKKNGTY